jgi:hypothetical protein
MFSPVIIQTLKELAYIRKNYRKPAYLDVKVRPLNRCPDKIGSIKGAESGFLIVAFVGESKDWIYPPDGVEYIGVEAIQ